MPVMSIRPARVLLHPLWLGALVVLAANDQWLKFADLLPPVVTGKLSDVAGLLVAPAILATCLDLRSKRSWWLAHLAIAIVFASLQLSTFAADRWSSLMGAFGFPWQITSDPTDLIALPMLLVSARVLWPAMRVPSPKLARRSAEAGAAAVGLLCCVATSREPPGAGWLPDIEADVWLHNGTGEEQVIRVRPLRASVQLDCYVVAQDPARLLDAALFDDVQSWTLPDDANLSVLDHELGEADCYAARIDADAFEPVLLFWSDGRPAITMVPGAGVSDLDGMIDLRLDDDGHGEYEPNGEVLFRASESSEPTGECAAQDDAFRVDWGDEVPFGQFRVQALVPGVDGCTAIDLAGIADETTKRMYLCTPAISLPFAVGDAIDVRRSYGVQSDAVVIEKLGDDLAPAMPAAALWVSRGADVPALAGLQVSVVPSYECAYAVDECGTVGRAVGLTVGGDGYEPAQIKVGEAPITLAGADGSSWAIALAHGQERAVIDSECAAGPAGLGYDIEIVAIFQGAAQ
jgi:hypothetical protein